MPLPDVIVVTPAVLRAWPLPPPGPTKDAGRTLVVGGSCQNPGAVILAAEAALRSGAGKLQVATVVDLAPHVATALPEALVQGLPSRPDGDLAVGAADGILELADSCSSVLLGPGFHGVDAAVTLLEAVAPHLDTTVVLDALAMAYITGKRDGVAHLGGRVILTPNVRELAQTLKVDAAQVDSEPVGSALSLAMSAHAVVVSGGQESWVATPEGQVWLVQSGNRGLAVSGSGDVEAGIIAGLCARGASPAQAATWGVHLHGRAGERLAASVGRFGFLARELPAQVPRILVEIEA
jgi:ADP-dependent NAD(P)H-hydrate dehydratase